VVKAQVMRVAHAPGRTLAPVAIGVFVWSASTGIHSVFDALEVQVGAVRPWWKKRLIAIGTSLGLSLGVAVLGLLASGLDWIDRLAGEALPNAAIEAGANRTMNWIVRAGAGFAVAVGMVAALYRIGIPREARGRFPILPGAVFAVLLIGALGWGYGVYLSHAGTGSAYLGSLAAIGVTMMTLWLFSVALLLGAELNHVLGEKHGNCPPDGDVARRLPTRTARARWPTSAAFWSRPTSPRALRRRSNGLSHLLRGSARRSR
jgi:membrane protein